MNRKDAVRWLGSIFRFIPVKWIYSLAGKPLLIPFYHTVSNDNLSYINHRYHVKSVLEFESDIKWLIRNFKTKNPANFDTCFSRDGFFLTFDDGFKECSSTIAPILLKYNLSAIFFINTAFLDDKELPTFIKENNKNKIFLNSHEVKSIIQQGFLIGSHGHRHPLYSSISFDAQVQEIEQSKAYIKNKFQLDIQHFAYPFTDFGLSKAEILNLRNYCGIRYSFGTAGIKNEDIENHFQRIPMENGKASAKIIIKGELIVAIVFKILNNNIVKRKA